MMYEGAISDRFSITRWGDSQTLLWEGWIDNGVTPRGGDYGIGSQQGFSNTAAAYISGIQDALGGKSN